MSKTQKTFKAFRIVHAFSLPGGRRFKKADYYQANSAAEEEILGKAQFALELPSGTPAPTPLPEPVGAPPPATTKGDAFESEESDEPDWSFQTIKSMREWLDRSGVELLSARASKGAHEELCRSAWASGRRPNPLYGFAGGPEPSAGMAGPNASDATAFAAAIEAAEAGGFEVPVAAREALKELTSPPAPAVPAPAQGGEEKAPQGSSEPASEPDDGAEGEPSQPTNEVASEHEKPHEEALFDDVLASMEPVRADGQPATEPELAEGFVRSEDGTIAEVE